LETVSKKTAGEKLQPTKAASRNLFERRQKRGGEVITQRITSNRHEKYLTKNHPSKLQLRPPGGDRKKKKNNIPQTLTKSDREGPQKNRGKGPMGEKDQTFGLKIRSGPKIISRDVQRGEKRKKRSPAVPSEGESRAT